MLLEVNVSYPHPVMQPARSHSGNGLCMSQKDRADTWLCFIWSGLCLNECHGVLYVINAIRFDLRATEG